eukprot:scaffold1311_cov256-Pinguiococcus_pyrenoidosus.AAC.60
MSVTSSLSRASSEAKAACTALRMSSSCAATSGLTGLVWTEGAGSASGRGCGLGSTDGGFSDPGVIGLGGKSMESSRSSNSARSASFSPLASASGSASRLLDDDLASRNLPCWLGSDQLASSSVAFSAPFGVCS